MKLLVSATLLLASLPAAGLPDPATDLPAAGAKQRSMVIAGGCFWCTEAVFEQVRGVLKVVSGYAGGDAKTARYEIVGSGRTNHAEAIEITYDPGVVSYGTLLKVFFQVAHDPTQKDRQGPDYGRQYRSAIFFANLEEKQVAAAYMAQIAPAFKVPIATTLEQLTKFYPAEDYHQDYVANHPMEMYVRVNSIPKVEKLKRDFPQLLKSRKP